MVLRADGTVATISGMYS